MNGFLEAVKNCRPESEVMTLTAVSGEAKGEKAVLCDGEIAYLSDSRGFFDTHRDAAKKIKDSGIESIDDTEIYTERLGGVKKLVICGCGHVSLPIIKLGHMLGFHVTAIDDRQEFVDRAREAGADKVFCDTFDRVLGEIASDRSTYFVIVTRGHRWDEECLKIICGKPYAYTGMMGSKRRSAIVKENLLKEGIDREAVEKIHTPIGLSIGSETPEEIAVSIMAEIIEVKNACKEQVIPDDIMQAAVKDGEKILATIIKRSGSAPRGAGTKMLILKDGSIVNTIGGGLMEATVIKKAVEMLSYPESGAEVLDITLNAGAASEEGEVCGGELSILLERV